MGLNNNFMIDSYNKTNIEKLLNAKVEDKLFSCPEFNNFLKKYDKELDSISPEDLKKIYKETGIKINRKIIGSSSLLEIDKDSLELETETINYSNYSRFKSNIISEIEKQIDYKYKIIDKKNNLDKDMENYKDIKLEYFEKIEKIDKYIEDLGKSIRDNDIYLTTRVDSIKAERNKLGLFEKIIVNKDDKEYSLNIKDVLVLKEDEFDGKYSNVLEIIDGNYVVSTIKQDEASEVEYYAHTNIDSVYGLEGKWGLVDINDNVIIKPKYIYPFIECGDNLQAMLPHEYKEIDGKKKVITLKHGLIDKLGKVIIPIKYLYMEAMDSSGTYFRVVDSKTYKSGVIDKNNNIVVPFDYEYIQASPDLELCEKNKFCSTYPDYIYQVKVSNNDLYGIYDLKLEKEIIKPKYKHIKIIGYNRFLVGETYETCNTLINEKEEVIMK